MASKACGKSFSQYKPALSSHSSWYSLAQISAQESYQSTLNQGQPE